MLVTFSLRSLLGSNALLFGCGCSEESIVMSVSFSAPPSRFYCKSIAGDPSVLQLFFFHVNVEVYGSMP